MKQRVLSIIKYLIFLGIGVFLMWWQLSKMTSLQKIQFEESLKHANYFIIIPIIIMAILSHLSRAVRWKILIEPMGFHPSTSNTFYATMCGYFANTFVPRAGEILRCTLLGRYEKIPVSKLVGTILVERVFDLFCYLIIIIITISIQIETVSDFLKTKIEKISYLKNSNSSWMIIIFIVIGLALSVIILKKLFKKHEKHRHMVKLKGLHVGLKEGFYTIIHLKKRKTFIAHTLFIWSMYLLEIYVGFYALSATSSLGIGAAFSVLSLSTLAMIIAPGGIGAFPVAVQQVLLIYMIDNISFGWLMWGVTTGIIIIAGIICFGLIIYNNKNKNEKERYNTGTRFESGENTSTGNPLEAKK